MATSKKTMCPSCEAILTIKDEALIGTKVDCPKCKYKFVVEVMEPVKKPVPPAPPPKKKVEEKIEIVCDNCGQKAKVSKDKVGATVECIKCHFDIEVKEAEPTDWEEILGSKDDDSDDDGPKAKAKPKKKAKDEDDSDDDGDKKTEPAWYNVRHWDKKTWVIACVILLVVWLVLRNVVAPVIWPKPDGWDGKKKPATPPAATVKDDNAALKAQVEELRKQAEIARLKLEKQQAEEKLRLEAEKKRLEEEANKKPMPKVEPKKLVGMSYPEYFKGKFEVTYQKARKGEWVIESFNEKTGQFSGKFSHPFNKGHDGTLSGKVAKDGTIEATMTVMGKDAKDGQVKKFFEFKLVNFKIEVESDGSIKPETAGSGKMVYAYVLYDVKGVMVGVVPEKSYIFHDYQIVKMTTP